MPAFLQPASSYKRKEPDSVDDDGPISRKRVSSGMSAQFEEGTSSNGLNTAARHEQVWMVQW